MVLQYLKNLRYKRNLVRAKKVYNKTMRNTQNMTKSAVKAMKVFTYNPNSYIVRTVIHNRPIRNSTNLAYYIIYSNLNSFKTAHVHKKHF